MSYAWAKYPDRAEVFGTSLLDHLEMLRTFPYIGAEVSGRSNVRQVVHTPLLIYYVVHFQANSVEILHISHASRHRDQ
jgi:plasmid stabilization system protein ParE